MFEGVQASFDLILQTIDVFGKQCFFRLKEANAHFFQMSFIGLTESFTSIFTWNKHNANKLYFPREL